MTKKIVVFWGVLFLLSWGSAAVGETVKPGLVIAQGVSAALDSRHAVDEAVAMAGKQLKGGRVKYVMVVSSIGHDYPAVIKGLRKAYGGKAGVWGLTSHKGVMTRTGWLKGKGLSIMAFSSDKMDIGVGGAPLGNDPAAATRAACKAAVAHAGKTVSDMPKLVLLTSSFGLEEKLVREIEGVFGADVPVFGGASGDDELNGQWRQIANDQVFDTGISVSLFYTDLKIGLMFGSGVGYITSQKKGIVTRSEGRRIYEIDNRPAGEVYNEWLDGQITEKVANGGSLMFEGILDPLSQTVKSRTGATHNLTLHAIEVKKEDKSLVALATTRQGDEISVLHGSPDAHFNRPPIIAVMSRTAGRIPPDRIAGTLFLCCACTHMVLQDQVGGFIPMVNRVLNNAPFVGAFTFGEQGYIPGIGNRHQNLINSMIVFGN